jgi:hypothetical protein
MDKTSFDCEACDGHLFSLRYDAERHFLVYDNGWRTTRVPRYALEAVKFAMEQRNARLLYGIDEDYVRDYCVCCNKLYCGNHWTGYPIIEADGWCDGFVRTCPEGHRKEI